MVNKTNTGSNNKKIIIYIVLAIATLAVYWQASRFDFINFDDPVYIMENSYVKSGTTLEGVRWAFTTKHTGLWYPLVWLSFMVDYQIYGLHPDGYHVTNLIFHILSTLLLFWLFCRMTGAVWKSAFVAAVFALHPLHVESVAWISERKDVLSAFFWMLTLCFYVYYTEKPVIRRYLLVFFCFALALMSKPMVVTLPVIMMLLDYWPLKRFESKKENVLLWQFKEKLPLLMLSIIFSVVTLIAQHKPPVKIIPLGDRLANASFSFMTYLERIFWPQDLSFFYSFPEQIHSGKISGTVLLIIIISLAFMILAKRLPYLPVGWFWYAITIAPVLGLTYIGVHWMHDLYTYLPSIGIVIGIAWGLPALIMNDKILKNIIFPLTIGLLIILSLLSWKQTGFWRNSIELFTHALHLTEDNYPAYDQRGIAYGQTGHYQQAIRDFNRAIALNPDYYKGYNNRGFAYAKSGQYQNAVNDYSEAIRLKPDYARAYENRAIVHLNHGNYLSGCNDARQACQLGYCSTLKDAANNGLCR